MTYLSVRMTNPTYQPAPASAAQTTSAVASQSFADQLSQAFAETLSKMGIDPNTVSLTVDNNSSQTNVSSQNSAAPSVFSALASSTPSTASAVSTASQPEPHSASDVYWAKQPAAVQQLRQIDDSGQRAMMAAQLSAEGYSIDVPVMVWGWDAGKITQLRQGFGYTWVPSAMQTPISVAPGIGGGPFTPYDPAHAPAGSISV